LSIERLYNSQHRKNQPIKSKNTNIYFFFFKKKTNPQTNVSLANYQNNSIPRQLARKYPFDHNQLLRQPLCLPFQKFLAP